MNVNATAREALRLLLVEDDAALSAALAGALRRERLDVCAVDSGELALDAMSSARFQIMVLDLGLPGIDGFEVLTRVRAGGLTLPVIVLTANETMSGKKRALDLGADLFLWKPIAVSELLDGVRIALARVNSLNQKRIECGPIALDIDAGQAFLNGDPLDLARREWLFLVELMSHTNQTLSKKTLARALATGEEEVSAATLEMIVCRLRAKLGSDHFPIRTVRGLGYRFDLRYPRP